MRVFVAGKLVQRTWQDDAGNKRQSVEIQVTHVGPDLQFATAEVTKSTAEGLKSSSDGPSAASSAEEKQRQ
jgi:single-strand DNA-binding protein